MSVFPFLGSSTPRSLYQLERAMEDAVEAGNAAWDQEHDGQGHHTTLTADSLASRTTGTPVTVLEGLRYMAGPWLLEADGNNPAIAVVAAPALTASVNDYNPSGLDRAIVLEVDATGDVSITGIVTTRRRRLLLLVNRSNYTITLPRTSASSTSTYRFSSTHILLSGEWVWLYYDAGSEIWRGKEMSGIRSIQRGTITITAGNTTTTATLATTLIDVNKCLVSYLGTSADTIAGPDWAAYLDNLTTTTIRATRGSTSSTTVVAYQIEERY